MLLKQVFDYMKPRLPPCILAGGAVRDTLLNQPVKDYDFFVNISDPLDVEFLGLDLGFNLLVPNIDNAKDYEHNMNCVTGVLDGRIEQPIVQIIPEYEPFPDIVFNPWVQVIAVNMPEFTPEKLVEQFDLCLSQAWTTDGETLCVTEAFQRDAAAHTVSYTGLLDKPTQKSYNRARDLAEKLGYRNTVQQKELAPWNVSFNAHIQGAQPLPVLRIV